jgi:hypothetical protein
VRVDLCRQPRLAGGLPAADRPRPVPRGTEHRGLRRRADPSVIKTITSHPQSKGWLADPDKPLGEAAAHYSAFIRRGVTALAQAHVTGKPDAVWETPEAFRSVDGLA